MARTRTIRVVASIALRVLVLGAPPLLVANALFAAPKGKKAAPAKPTKGKGKGKGAKDAGTDAASEAGEQAADKSAEKSAGEKAPDAGAASGESGELLKETEKKEGDASVKVFEFGTTEIEGRARWPAVTYFVRRMRAEFEAQKLPHRPFLPELEATKGDPSVK